MSNDTRSLRYHGRAALRRVTSVKRCRDCGRSVVSAHGMVGVRVSDGKAGYAGLATCGRIWLCPVCNSKIMARRAVEIQMALAWAHREGHFVIWGSLTCWHTSTSRLDTLLDVQRAAWRHVVQSRAWSDAKADRPGYIRASEITIGANGWHPHFHPIILHSGTRAAAESFAGAVVARWLLGVRKAGGRAVSAGAQSLVVLAPADAADRLAEYVTKSTYDPDKLALEAVWSQSKGDRGRVKGTQSHWSLLAGIAQGLADDASRWWELEDATRGHRAITWSRGLRKLAGISAEKSDEEIAAEELGTKQDTVCYITRDGWAAMRDDAAFCALVLSTLEASGWDALRQLLDANGIEWVPFEELHAMPFAG